MTSVDKLITNKQPMPNIRFQDTDKVGSNIFFVPEAIDSIEAQAGLKKFLDTQIKSYYQQITIPGIISNFLGKKLANQKYYLHAKKEMPNYIYSRSPGKQMNAERTNIFDFSGIIGDIMSTAKARSQKMVFQELNKLIGSVTKDYPQDRKNYLVIYGSTTISSDNAEFLNFLIYINKLSAGKIKTNLDGIIYILDGKFYPIAIPDDKNKDKSLKFLRNILGSLLQYKNKVSTGIDNINPDIMTDEMKEECEEQKADAREKITKIVNDNKDLDGVQKEIKGILHGLPGTVGTTKDKLESLFNGSDNKVTKDVEKLNKEVNRKYNGNVQVDIPKTGVFNAQKIVGMDEVGNYNKQQAELTENIDELVEDLVYGTLENDPDIDIKVLGIKTKIVDDNKNRYKEYQVKIQHKDFGKTTNKPYTVSFRVPVPVQGKYIKLGGNNYILINQLFPKPIQKIAPNLVRFYTHFSVASLSIKNAKLTASNGFIELEEKFVQHLKSINAIKVTNFKNETKDELSTKYGIDDLKSFKYESMKIKV